MRRLVTWTPLAAAFLALPLAAVAAGGPARHAEATFTDATGATVGWAKLVEDGAGRVHVNVHVDGLSAGRHGIHIHAVGACGPTFAAPGRTTIPSAGSTGSRTRAAPMPATRRTSRSIGAGIGHLDAVTDRSRSGRRRDAVRRERRAFIIHANEDDQLTDATNGNSGARIACAVIEAVAPRPD